MTKNLAAILCCAFLALTLVAAKPDTESSAPSPADIRSFSVIAVPGAPAEILIDSVDAPNGLVITDLVCAGAGQCVLSEDDGSGGSPVQLILLNFDRFVNLHFRSGIPVKTGSRVTAEGDSRINITGYVF